ncbi:MAG: isoquinoline 1-oxidoreductase, beta subunit [Pseudomonadota bacterium]
MQDFRIVNESRRELLKGGAALTLALYLPSLGGCASDASGGELAPNAFVRIGHDHSVTVISKHLEMGQGTYTGLATLVADELDADWSQVRVEGAPADTKKYMNTAFGMQGTGGSTATYNSYEQYRQAGATARAMLVSAAAKQWGVAPGDIRVERGVLKGGSHEARFGELVGAASKLPVPEKVELKAAAQFTLIGKPAARVDALAKATGKAQYTQDVQLPGMLTAVVARAPRFGAKVRSVDDSKARAIPGVVQVVRFETPVMSGVAVLAKGFWAARQGRDALVIDWDDSAAVNQGSAEISADYHKLAQGEGKVVRNDGDAAALKSAAHRLEARYEVPYLAHAAMEPLNCVVQLGEGSCEIWNGEQFQTVDQMNVSRLLGIKPEQVKLNMLFAGGSFGRRANAYSDYVVEAVAIAKSAGTKVPVKLVWTREEDMRGGFYRPMYVHALQAGLDAHGMPVAWRHHVVGQSIMDNPVMAGMMKDGIDETSVEGGANLPYAIPNLRVELSSTKLAVPILWWRSVGSSHNAWATECFLDEVAHAAHRDPLELRRALLAKSPRHLAVLELAASKAGWGDKLPAGHARGLAVAESFNSYVAHVVEISRKGPAKDNRFHIERVTSAVDCGVAVNPNIIAMQVESAVCFGLSAALLGKITLEAGAVQESNFNGYPVLRMNEMPTVDVHIVPSTERPTGIGEPGVPPIAPALCNALFALTGQRQRSLPLSAHGIEFS